MFPIIDSLHSSHLRILSSDHIAHICEHSSLVSSLIYLQEWSVNHRQDRGWRWQQSRNAWLHCELLQGPATTYCINICASPLFHSSHTDHFKRIPQLLRTTRLAFSISHPHESQYDFHHRHPDQAFERIDRMYCTERERCCFARMRTNILNRATSSPSRSRQVKSTAESSSKVSPKRDRKSPILHAQHPLSADID